VYVAADGEAVLLGVSRQLIGNDWQLALAELSGRTNLLRSLLEDPNMHASTASFRYTGSIGPLLLDSDRYHKLQRIGATLSSACGFAGLFGVDAILDAEDVWPVEINPRYTASIEVLERASAVRTKERRAHRLLTVEWHEAACCFRQLPAALGQSTESISGKLIYYARKAGSFSTSAARWVAQRNLGHSRPVVADIPAQGTAFRAGQPVLTLLADGTSTASVAEELRQALEELESILARDS
jgi:predicted ATP-grasp superfamily ATP-dependent carboligase